MRFVFNTLGYKPAYEMGGPIHSVAALAEGLISRGHEVFVATTNKNGNGLLDVDTDAVYELEGVKVRYFASSPSLLQRTKIPYFSRTLYCSTDRRFKAWLRESAPDFDIFHTQLTFLSSTPYFSKTAQRQRKAYLFHQRGNLDPVRLQYRGWKKRLYLALLEIPAMKRADALIGLTEYERTTYKALGLQNRVVILPNGISLADLDGGAKSCTAEMKLFLDECGDEPIFLFLGRIHPVKGADLFVDAFLRFVGEGGSGIGVLAGPDECGFTDAWRIKVSSFGLASRFRFSGPVTGPNKWALLRRADCFILPTASEGFSMAILEAMGSGCAILTTPGAHFDELEQVGAGRIVNRNIAAVTAGLHSLSNLGRKGMGAIGRKGRALVERDYCWTEIVTRYESLCLETLERKKFDQSGLA